MKESFVLFTEQKEIFENLSDEQAGQLIKAIFNYIETNKTPKLNELLNIAFIPIRQSIDRNNDKWEDIRKKRSESGKIGAEIKKQKQAKEANAKFAKNKIANQAVNVSVNDSVSVNVNDNNNNIDDSCVDGLQEIVDFYNENIGLITPYGVTVLSDYEKELGKDIVIFAMEKAVESNIRTIAYIKGTLNNWENSGVKTLIEAKEESRKFRNKNIVPEETEEEKIQRKIKALEEGLTNDK